MKEYLLLAVGILLVLYGTGAFTGFLTKEGKTESIKNIKEIENPAKEIKEKQEEIPEEIPEGASETNETTENQTLKTIETEEDLCENVKCEITTITCPDGESFFCINTCIPETGNCTSCVPDCTGHERPMEDEKQEDEKQENTYNQNIQTNRSAEEEVSEKQGINHIIFSQIYYNAEGNDNKNEWIELYNPTSEDIDISGYTLNDNQYVFFLPEGSVIKAGKYFVVAKDASGFYNLSGCMPDVYGSTLRLSNSGDYIYLNNSDGEIDYVSWDEWNISAGEGKVIKRKDMQTDTDSPNDWVGDIAPIYRC